MRNNKSVIFLVGLLILALLVSGCRDTNRSESSKSTTTSSETTSTQSQASETESEDLTTTSEGSSMTENSQTEPTKKSIGDTKTSGSEVQTDGNYKLQLKQSDYIADAALWKTPLLRPQGFQFSNAILPNDTSKNTTLMERSIDYYEVGEYISLFPQQRAWEWDYGANHFVPGPSDKPVYTGWGARVTENSYLDYLYKNYQDMLQAQAEEKFTDFYPVRSLDPAATRAGALKQLKTFVTNVFKIDTTKPWISNNGHYSYHHYAGEFGATVIGSEVGENIHNYQMQISFNRGAARQYQKPWTVCFSYWHGPVATNYDTGAGNQGHSVSLFKRSILMSYMAGVDVFDTEGGGNNSFLPIVGDNGFYELSPHGVATQEFMKFQKSNSNIGVNYTPVGIILDYYHGTYARDGVGSKAAFNGFTYGPGDNMTWSLYNLLWPGAWTTTNNEVGTLTNNGMGDYFDTLLQNAPQKVLNTYPALVLTGNVQLSDAEKARYRTYAEQGGTLVLNTAYISQFPEYQGELGAGRRYEKTVGKGRVIVYGDDYKIDKLAPILRELVSRYVPIKVSGDIQQMVNFKDGVMYVTLINNDGVTKTSYDEPVIDHGKYKNITVTYTGPYTVKAVKDVYGGQEVRLSGEIAKVTVPPGDAVVLEFKI